MLHSFALHKIYILQLLESATIISNFKNYSIKTKSTEIRNQEKENLEAKTRLLELICQKWETKLENETQYINVVLER